MRSREAVAIIGMACRLPGASTPREYWTLLASGSEAIGDVPAGRWDRSSATEPARGGFIAGVDQFDADFFGISPREAAAMDPQQRLVLEMSWEALEEARIVPDTLRGSAGGVFMGVGSGDYAGLSGPPTHHSVTGLQRGIVANRVSYALGWHGPSLAVDSAHSSALTAVHLAIESLRSGESAVALAGGVHLMLAPEGFESAARLGALSPDGRCYVFDARANGYVRGEGGGVVVLKRLSDAIADGDPVVCLVLGSAANHGGAADALTVPSRAQQEDLIRRACQNAGVEPHQVQYIELHGTGTPVGDPVEAAALGAVFGPGRDPDASLLVGSVKTNIGHLEGAAGIAGLLKTVLSIRHRAIPPSLNYERPPETLPLAEWRVRLPKVLSPWPMPSQHLVAGVSSFGIGGANCHVVLAEPSASSEAVQPHLAPATLPWTISGRTPAALRAQAGRLVRWLAEDRQGHPADVGFSLATTRSVFERRAVIVAGEDAEFRRALGALSRGEADPCLVEAAGAVPVTGGTAFVFPGQGSQWAGMGAELLNSSSVFRDQIRACAAVLDPLLGWSLVDVLRGTAGAPPLNRDDVVQPALFAMMVSLAALWQSFGIRPDAVVGHSQGEIAAAHVAGALSLEDAARIVVLRGQALAGASRGGMVFVALPVAEVRGRLNLVDGDLWIAAVNGPASTVVSGTLHAIGEFTERCQREGVRTRVVPIDYASHSPHIEQIRDDLLALLEGMAGRPAPVPFYSTVTGGVLDGGALDADYWFRNLRQPVEFETTVRALAADGHRVFIEPSPHPVLTADVRETLDQETGTAPVLARETLRRDDGTWSRFLTSLARVHVSGPAVRWASVYTGTGARATSLPTYAFQRERHWVEQARRGPALAAASVASAPDADDWAAPASEPVSHIGQLQVAERDQVLADLVRSHANRVLGHPDTRQVAADRTFKDLGFDSVTGLELCNRLSEATGRSLSASLIFDYPTPAELTRHLTALMFETALQAPSAVTAQVSTEPIAIVGMACRYPGGVQSPEDFWDLVAAGTDTISGFPNDRGWNISGIDYAPVGGFLADAAGFDAAFFGVSPREAMAMDPQQRLMLEVSWEAIERSGTDPSTLRGSQTGVFAGVMSHEYGYLLAGATEDVADYALTGTSGSVVSGRVAYALGLEGPAVSVDTACSSSLVALHMACAALRAGECSLALAGGVTVMSTPSIFSDFRRQGGLAADGRCKPFSAAADGTGWAEGVGVVVVERLGDALRNGRQVLALVRGSALSQDGASNGLTAPNGPSQQRVIRQALAAAGLTAGQVDAVEAHGTGTSLGDPIEAQALMAAYGPERPHGQPLWLGSVKSNIGHSQAAAGIAGVIKAVQAMRHGALPRTLHADQPSPHIDWSDGTVALLTEAKPWPQSSQPRRYGVSSFGISGTNAHVILEEAAYPGDRPNESVEAGGPDQEPPGPIVPWVVSGHGAAGLRAQARRLADWLTARPRQPIADVGWSLARSRAVLPHRAVLAVATAEQALTKLAGLAEGAVAGSLAGTMPESRSGRGLCLLFPGQGGQWAGMGRELSERFPVYAAALDETCAALEDFTGFPLRTRMLGDTEPTTDPAFDGEPRDLNWAGYAQPAVFAFEVAMWRLLESFGVTPSLVIGHSFGEAAAAFVAGVLSLEDACQLVAARGRLMGALPPGGAMAALEASEDEISHALVPGAVLAVVNGPRAVVVSGDEDAVARVTSTVQGWGRRVQPLRISHASHSPRMDDMEHEFAAALSGLRVNSPRIPMLSTLTGAAAGEELRDTRYWVRQVREPVRFADAVRAAAKLGVRRFAETGPGGGLAALAAECLPDENILAVSLCRKDRAETVTFLEGLGAVFADGVDVTWAAAFTGLNASSADLPTYAFQHERFWPFAAGNADVQGSGLTRAGHPMLGAVLRLADTETVVLSGRISLHTHPWLGDHSLAGAIIVPGTLFMELALRAGDEVSCPYLDELVVHTPLQLHGPHDGSADNSVRIQVMVGAPGDDGRRTLEVYAKPESSDPPDVWTRHATGMLAPVGPAPDFDLVRWPPPGATPIDVAGFYDRLADVGYQYGPAFRGVTAAWRDRDEMYAEVSPPTAGIMPGDTGRYQLHPAVHDSALHLLISLIGNEPGSLRLPFSWSGVSLHAAGANSVRVRLAITDPDTATIMVADPLGRPVFSAESLVLRPAPAAQLAVAGLADDEKIFALDWEPLSVDSPALDAPPRTWAFLNPIGPDHGQVWSPNASTVAAHADVSALSAAFASGAGVPDAVGLTVTGPVHSAHLASSAHELTGDLLRVLQQFLSDPRLAGSRLVVVTRGAVATGPGDDVTDLAAAAAWGLAASAQAEHPGRVLLVDAEPTEAAADSAPGFRLAWSSPAEAVATAVATNEWRMAVRGGSVLVPRVERADRLELVPPAAGEPWRLTTTAPGSLEGLRLVAASDAKRTLGPDEVRVKVTAAGLNFRDVLTALGMFPDDSVIGHEFSGIVTQIGAEVSRLRPGDKVMGLAPGACGPLVVADARMVTGVPDGLSLLEAAGVPVVFLTALYGLTSVAGLREGEKVLVHAAAGGVGMAAVQVARWLGAEVFGTASPAKWPVLKSLGLDEAHIASSRDEEFERAFLRTTDGAGVDVVLNALTGPLMDASLRLLPRGGRFAEMGKTDLREPSQVSQAFPGVAYRAFDVLDVEPDHIGQMLTQIAGLMETGVLRPLPMRQWPVTQAAAAFRFMSQGRNVGKLALSMPPAWDPDGTVLITGGTGALGSAVARHVVTEHGVRHLVLASRRGLDAPHAGELVSELRELGAQSTTVVACDLSDGDRVAALVAEVQAGRRLSVVIHAAGVVSDGVVTSLTAKQLAAPWWPKAAAAWHLHQATQHLDLDMFVLFSSVMGILGSPGQGNYAAANVFLDALAARRLAHGLPAISLAWGLWEQASGMTRNLSATDQARLRAGGLAPMPTAEALVLLDRALAVSRPVLITARLTRPSRGHAAGSLMRRVAINARSRHSHSAPAAPAAANPDSLARQLALLPDHQRRAYLLNLVRSHAAAVLGHADAGQVDAYTAFKDVGFDSLASVELRNRLSQETSLQLSSTITFGHPTPVALAEYLAHEMAPDAEETAGSSLLGELDRLEGELSRIAAEETGRIAVTKRLRALLSRWTAEPPPAPGNAAQQAAQQLESATTIEEVMDYMQKQLGIE
jgi:acyl transferase domain-containing protein/NADPH:quinone reductase-like Zn-dependent oxidoreductase